MPTQKIGTGMMAIAFIIALGLMTVFFADVESRQYNPNPSPDSTINEEHAQVTLKRNRQGHYVATGLINRKSAEFLLDTGATDVVIPMDLADHLSLRRGQPGRAMTANGPVTVYSTSIDELTIGDIKLYNVPASINPGMSDQAILLGMSALKQIEFVQRGDSLTLRQLY